VAILHWLLSHEALQVRMVRAIREARTPLTAKAPEPKPRAGAGGLPSVFAFDGATATISVRGVLTPVPDAEAAWFDEPNTVYGDLQESLRIAASDPRVRDIVWDIDSPGGAVDGLFGLLDDIGEARASGVKMSVVADNAHSAAYGIAAAVGNITARSRMSSFGSVGVATSGFISGGICGTVVDIASSELRRSDPTCRRPKARRSSSATSTRLRGSLWAL
jgi:ClpP class serine protease